MLFPKGGASRLVPRYLRKGVGVSAVASISAYNDMDEPFSGALSGNGKLACRQPWQQARQRRALNWVADLSGRLDLGDVLDEIDAINGRIACKNETPTQSQYAAMQYYGVFGCGNALERNGTQRCRMNAAPRVFLSHWLVGGETPPKSEI